MRHVLPNSLIPVMTFLAIDLGALMGGAIIVEGVFNIPGIGGALFQAIKLQEGTTVVGISVFLDPHLPDRQPRRRRALRRRGPEDPL